PESGRQIVIEMNPRVSRSSALASKATGFPIAKIAAKLAVGYTLNEIPNDITKKTPASFEPTIDYVVVKIPRWAFEKFPGADPTLTTRMKSVGEAMSIGRTFKEALQKGLRSLETGWSGLDNHPLEKLPLSEIPSKLTIPNIERLFYIKQALRLGMSIDQLYDYTQIDPFFLYNIKEIVDFENVLAEGKDPILVHKAKQLGFSDKQIGEIWKMLEVEVREMRKELGVEVTFKTVDTCA
ncbi:uncharacterized protein METZ01_LOCUS492931, partial [marine metagenome]